MSEYGQYTNIDTELTGRLLERRIRQSGYTVKELQHMLHLSCPQPIYRWFKGRALPSVDHLLFLSRILQCYMEELLVVRGADQSTGNWRGRNRLLAYWKFILRKKDKNSSGCDICHGTKD